MDNRKENSSIDDYIASFPEEIQSKLEDIRSIIKAEAPGASEAIRYGIPTFILKENLVHFAAFKKHIGFYPTPSGIEKFRNELSVYPGAKGSVQFPLDQPLPYDLIRRIVAFRFQEVMSKPDAKGKKKM